MRPANDIYIRSSRVRLIDSNGQLIGIYGAKQAKDIANDRDQDLVPVDTASDPAVYKLKGEYIEATEIRLLDTDRSLIGIVSNAEAKRIASDKELELIPLNEKAIPPVYMVGDLNKFRYNQQKAQKEQAKKNRAAAKASEEKELQIPSVVSDSSNGDMMRLINKGNEFLAEGHPVKFKVFFAGRQITHADADMDRIIAILREHITNGIIGKVDRADKRFFISCQPMKRK